MSEVMYAPVIKTDSVKIYQGDCCDLLPVFKAGSVDAVITDPPYPCIKRDYGTWTEDEWFAMMRTVVPECMRILKPTGSAVFILQPNSEKVGRMRTWLWEFMVWVGKEYGVVQDAYWWNTKSLPEAHSIQGRLMRPSLKTCVWVGKPNCYRDQDAVLWDESDDTKVRRLSERARGKAGRRHLSPGGQGVNTITCFDAAERRGGVTPYNVLPMNHGRAQDSAGGHGHGAGTPLTLSSWWVRYICPPGGTVLDPFIGSGTTALACLKEGRKCRGVERMPGYVDVIRNRLNSEK